MANDPLFDFALCMPFAIQVCRNPTFALRAVHVLIHAPPFDMFGGMKPKCSDEQFVERWKLSGTIAEVAAALGMTRNSVMSRAYRLRHKKGYTLGELRVQETWQARLLRLALLVIAPQGFSTKKGMRAKVDPADLEAFIGAVAERYPNKDFVTDAFRASSHFYRIMDDVLGTHEPPWSPKPGNWDLVGILAEKKKVARPKACKMLGLVPEEKSPG